jgi:hypothetical protein
VRRASRSAFGILRCSDDSDDARGKGRHDGRGQALRDEHAVAVTTLEERLDGALGIREAVDQSRAGVDQQVRRDGARGLVDRVLGLQTGVHLREQQRLELSENLDLRFEQLGLRSPQHANELFDAMGRAEHRASEPCALLRDRAGHVSRGRVARPDDRAAYRDSLDDSRADYRRSFGWHLVLGWLPARST